MPLQELPPEESINEEALYILHSFSEGKRWSRKCKEFVEDRTCKRVGLILRVVTPTKVHGPSCHLSSQNTP
jgi:hypothetical protein